MEVCKELLRLHGLLLNSRTLSESPDIENLNDKLSTIIQGRKRDQNLLYQTHWRFKIASVLVVTFASADSNKFLLPASSEKFFFSVISAFKLPHSNSSLIKILLTEQLVESCLEIMEYLQPEVVTLLMGELLLELKSMDYAQRQKSIFSIFNALFLQKNRLITEGFRPIRSLNQNENQSWRTDNYCPDQLEKEKDAIIRNLEGISTVSSNITANNHAIFDFVERLVYLLMEAVSESPRINFRDSVILMNMIQASLLDFYCITCTETYGRIHLLDSLRLKLKKYFPHASEKKLIVFSRIIHGPELSNVQTHSLKISVKKLAPEFMKLFNLYMDDSKPGEFQDNLKHGISSSLLDCVVEMKKSFDKLVESDHGFKDQVKAVISFVNDVNNAYSDQEIEECITDTERFDLSVFKVTERIGNYFETFSWIIKNGNIRFERCSEALEKNQILLKEKDLFLQLLYKYHECRVPVPKLQEILLSAFSKMNLQTRNDILCHTTKHPVDMVTMFQVTETGFKASLITVFNRLVAKVSDTQDAVDEVSILALLSRKDVVDKMVLESLDNLEKQAVLLEVFRKLPHLAEIRSLENENIICLQLLQAIQTERKPSLKKKHVLTALVEGLLLHHPESGKLLNLSDFMGKCLLPHLQLFKSSNTTLPLIIHLLHTVMLTCISNHDWLGTCNPLPLLVCLLRLLDSWNTGCWIDLNLQIKERLLEIISVISDYIGSSDGGMLDAEKFWLYNELNDMNWTIGQQLSCNLNCIDPDLLSVPSAFNAVFTHPLTDNIEVESLYYILEFGARVGMFSSSQLSILRVTPVARISLITVLCELLPNCCQRELKQLGDTLKVLNQSESFLQTACQDSKVNESLGLLQLLQDVFYTIIHLSTIDVNAAYTAQAISFIIKVHVLGEIECNNSALTKSSALSSTLVHTLNMMTYLDVPCFNALALQTAKLLTTELDLIKETYNEHFTELTNRIQYSLLNYNGTNRKSIEGALAR